MSLLLVHAFATWAMTGLIWCIQVVHYPLFAAVDREQFAGFERAHQGRITWVVAPLMLAELATAVLLWLDPPQAEWRPWFVAGLALLGVVWLSTALLQVPAHRRLSAGYDRDAHRDLVRTNWIRTAAWTMRSLLLILLLATAVSCAGKVPRQEVLGMTMPTVTGETLEGIEVTLPDASDPRPTVVLVGYVQRAQFDADRWLFGLLQAKTPARLYELPTIPGIFGGMAKGFIDGGMRSGIPSEDWSAVVTLYGDDAKRMKAFTGNEEGQNIRVMLLDRDGRVTWFHDRGYSAGKMLELDTAVREMGAKP